MSIVSCVYRQIEEARIRRAILNIRLESEALGMDLSCFSDDEVLDRFYESVAQLSNAMRQVCASAAEAADMMGEVAKAAALSIEAAKSLEKMSAAFPSG